MRRFAVKGVLIGGVVDIVSTNLFGIPVVMVAVFSTATPSSSTVNQSAAFMALLATPVYKVSLFVAGACASILGGYVAAWLAKHDELLNGALSAYLCILSGLIGMVTVAATPSDRLLELAFMPLSPALGLVGGYLRLRQVRSRSPHVV
ncbi:MAG: hypothetical protein JO103_01015 [Candidatus Eremiobacteraeota bacterium]|nr:hypothetical protein [Candidatus Eremiobacteraeota bacterium]MBV9408951.1 hypothetical protein [Candidatus Eremiobacteraeota bacterium]